MTRCCHISTNPGCGLAHKLRLYWSVEAGNFMEKATFGAGCFWGVQTTFDRIPGVEKTMVGYEGGTLENPTYKDVCTDRTGHAEVLEISFDPQKVSYQQLLDVFFSTHNPTELNRQG